MAPSPDTFSTQALTIVADVRSALLGMFESVHADPAQPQEVSRKFGLDKTLTWRIARTLSAENSLDAVLFMPRRPSITILTQALLRAGAPPANLARVVDECDRLESFIEKQAGDRDTFEIMIAGQALREGTKRLEQFRKEGFSAAAATWGVSARMHLATRLVMPGAKPGRVDLVTICGFLGFRRLRSNLPWTIASVTDWDSTEGDALSPEPLPCCSQQGAPLLPLDTTEPVSIRTVHEGRKTRFVLQPGRIGVAAATDVLLGWINADTASQFANHPGEQGEHGVFVNTPAESIVHDLLIHNDLAFAKPHEAAAYGMLAGGPGYPSPDAEESRLPVPTPITDLGRADMLHLAGFPLYLGTLKSAAESLGQPLSRFRAYRMIASYPPVPSLFVQRHGLLSR